MIDRCKVAGIIVIAAVFAAYGNHFNNAFHFDDFHTVIDNPHIRSLRNIPRLFTDATTFSVLRPNQTYRPIVSASLAFDYALGNGYNPFWFHITTFLIFLLQLAAMNIFFGVILHRTHPNQLIWIPALVATAWYGLHPVIAETVNYVIQRGDIYSSFGVVAALAIYARWPRLRRTGLYLVPFAIGLMSKPPAVVFPVLLFAYVCYFEDDSVGGETKLFPGNRCSRALRSVVPAVLVAAGLLVLQAKMTPATYTPSTLSGLSYRVTQPFVLLQYMSAFFLPLHLNVDTDLSPFETVNADVLSGLVFVAAMVGAILFTSRRTMLRPVSFGLLWFLVASLPTSLVAEGPSHFGKDEQACSFHIHSARRQESATRAKSALKGRAVRFVYL